MSKVFISYRRGDSADVSALIYDRLRRRYGSENVFKDVDTIPLGVDFGKCIIDSVSRCQVLLAVIGKQWLTVANQAGNRRLDDPGDFVRIEIEAALHGNIPVIPLLVQETTMPAAEALPQTLRELAFRNGIPVRDDPDFHSDMDRLIRHLDPLIRRAQPADGKPRVLKVFCSYSHKDEKFREQLEAHLVPLTREGVIADWHDRKILAGADWKGQIDEQLNAANIILLLVSTNFVASEYCYDLEMKRALDRHTSGTARVIPIILRPVDWQSAPFGKLQALPKDGKPVTNWKTRDHAFLNVAQGIRKAAEELRQA